GRTQDEAARQLGWPRGTLKGRLERGRALLHRRLARRGLTLSATLAVAGVAQRSAAAPSLLLSTTAHAASDFASGNVGVGSARAAALAQEATRAVALSRAKLVAAAVLLFGLLLAGTGVLVCQAPATQEAAGPERPPAADAPQPEVPLDALGDPLP